MSSDAASYRGILRSTSIVGGATGAAIVVGLARMKVFALVVGPAGVGLVGLLNAVVAAGSSLVGLGIGSSIVREIGARGDAQGEIARMRASFWALTGGLALLAVGLFPALARPLASDILGQPAIAPALAWMGLATGLSIVASSLTGEFQAFARIGDLARVQLLGAFGSALVGTGVVLWLGSAGLTTAVIALPGATLLAALLFRRGLPGIAWQNIRGTDARRYAQALIVLGTTLTVSGLLGTGAQLAVRAMIGRRLGLAAAGLFQASWAISAANLGLVLNAMAASFYPRLSRANGDPACMALLANQQLHVALVIGGALLIVMTAFAPFVLHLLYSPAFAPAETMLRWQLAGDALKIVGWAFGYVLIVRGDRRTYFACEALFAVAFPLLTIALIDRMGLAAAGVGYFIAYLAYALAVGIACARRHAIAVNTRLWALTLVLVAALLALIAAWHLAPRTGPWVSGIAAFGALVLAARELLGRAAPETLARVRLRRGT